MIKDLPYLDKPREKALAFGINNLSDAELIAILLRTGAKDISALQVAQNIIKEIGEIANINMVTVERLSQIKGVGKAKALTILSAIEIGKRTLKVNNNIKINNSKDIYNYVKYYFFKKSQELFMLLFLDNNKSIITTKIIYKGNTNRLSITAREVFKEAVLHASNIIVLVHNHPGGSIYPSKNDISTTRNLIVAGKVLQIQILDHLIVTDNNYYSFFDNGDLK